MAIKQEAYNNYEINVSDNRPKCVLLLFFLEIHKPVFDEGEG